MNKYLFTLTLLVSINSHSDITGAGEAAVFSQLVTMTNNLVEQVETLQNALDVSKKIEELEQAKAIRTLSDAGKNLVKSMDNLNDAKDTANGLVNDPFGIDSINSEISDLERKITAANNEENGSLKARKYARILRGLKNVKMFGQIVEDNKTKISQGMNDTDAIKSTAESNTVIADLLLQEHQKEIREDAENSAVFEGIFKAGKYNDLGKVEDFKYGE